MYTLVRDLWGRRLFTEQLPALVGAFAIADIFYKFGSFALECVAFLVTWFVIDAIIQALVRVSKRMRQTSVRREH
ncbi:MAG: hypothetical protein AAF637_08380 [Pseudomonadota bacterium]